jgi:7,8-dihydroneopterin aldolase/epimerase/oxygenase
MIVELHGLEVFGRHGAYDEERATGQTYLFDVEVDVTEAAVSDRLEDAVDYTQLAACVKAVSDGRQFHLLEALVASVADAIVERFPVDRVRVRVRKPSPPGLEADFAAATVERASP